MTLPRKVLVCLEDTPYYHIVSRCVRRAFLCGTDAVSGRCYEHRRQWVEDRIHILSSLFAIDIAAYSVMSNHYHLVLKLSPEQSIAWDTREILTRWTALYKGPVLVQQYLAGKSLGYTELQTVKDFAEQYRKRLCNLSWFMKCLNEPIAREANKEDGCTGHFFEGRFRSQALLTEQALLSCMAYVDLNPVRARVATTPEDSLHTSVRERTNPSFNLQRAIVEQVAQGVLLHGNVCGKPLLQFDKAAPSNKPFGLPCSESDYLELVDFTGRYTLYSGKGSINTSLPPILTRLGYNRDLWLENSMEFESIYQSRFSRLRVKFLVVA